MGSNGGGFRAKMEYYMNSGDKKHVFVGFAIVSAVACIPWYFMTRGAKHSSHEEYLEKARSQRLSSAPSAEK